MYPNVQADYTVVPGVSMPTDTRVTLTDGQLIDIDDFGQVRGLLAAPQFAAEPEPKGGALAVLGVIAVGALLNAAVAGLAFHVYNKRKSALAPAVAVGVSTAVTGVIIYALRR
jgi:hypothetical protein